MRINLLFFLLLVCHCSHLTAQIVLTDCGTPYIDPQDSGQGSGQSRDTLLYTTFFEGDSLLRSYFIDLNAFGGQQVDRARVFAILPDSSRKDLGSLAFGNCIDCVEGFAFVFNDSLFVEDVLEVEEMNLWLQSFGQPDFSLTGNLQTLTGIGRLSGTLPLCAIGMEVEYNVFNNTSNTTTEFATQIGCLEIVTNCRPELSADLDCQNNQLLLNASISSECIPTNAQIYWSNEAGERLADGMALQLPLIGNLGRYFWTVEDECCKVSEEIVVENPPFLSVGEDMLVCEKEEVVLVGSGGTNHFWEQIGMQNFEDSVLIFSVAQAENSGIYVLHGFNEEGCEDTDTLQLLVNVPPQPLVFLESACLGDTLQLQLSNDTVFTQIVWFDPQQNQLSFPFLPNLENEDFGTYSVQVVDTADCVVEQFFEVEAGLPPDIEIEFFESCDSLTAFLYPEEYEYVWETGDSSNIFSSTSDGIFDVTIRTQAGCKTVLPIEFVRSDTASVQLELTQPICPNDPTGTIEFIPTNPDVPTIYSIDGGITYSLFPTFKNLEPGIYNLIIQDDLGCLDSLKTELIAPPELGVQILQPPIEVRPNTPVQFSARTKGNIVEYQWIPKEIDTGTSAVDFIATNNMDIRIIVQDDRGCLASDGIPLTIVLGEIYVPNAFSPNQDGENDFFSFYSDGDSGEFIERLRIYDRWGTLLFEQNSFEINQPMLGWDGTYQGKEMNPNVYTYHGIVRFGDGSKKVFKGGVTLMR